MTQPFVFDESANSSDLTDADVLGAVPTSCAADITAYVEAPCRTCGKPWVREKHEKRFRFPHFYSRVKLMCPEGHTDQRVFQITWVYQPP